MQEQLKESLHKVRLDAALVDDAEVKARAQAGIDILESAGFTPSQDTLAPIISASMPAQPAPAQASPSATPESDDAIDAELLEIFLSEAEEVLDCVDKTLPESRSQPHNQEHLTTLRRSFHTLKGSGRMVGLVAFGEAAWGIEQVLNVRLADARPGDSHLYALLEKAAELLSAWVADLKTQGRSDRTPDALVRAAERVKAGEPFVFDEVSAELGLSMEDAQDTVDESAAPAFSEIALVTDTDAPKPEAAQQFMQEADLTFAPETISEAEAELPLALPEAEEVSLSDADMAMFNQAGSDTPASDTEPQPVAPVEAARPTAPLVAEVIEFPTMVMPETKSNDNVRRIGDLEISLPLYNIFLSETDELVRLLARDIAEWRHEPERHVNIQAVHAAHSLAGSSATVGFKILHELAHALEMVLQFLARKPVLLTAHEFDLLDQSAERLKLMLQEFASGEMPEHQPEHALHLVRVLQDLDARSMRQASSPSKDLPVTLKPVMETRRPAEPKPHLAVEPKSETGASTQLVSPASADAVMGENATRTEPAVVLKDELDADLLPVFLEEGRDMLPEMGQVLRAWQGQLGDAAAPQSLLRTLHTLKGSARMAGAMTLGQHLHEMETRIESLMRLGTPSAQAVEDLVARYDHALYLYELLQNPHASRETPKASPVEQALPMDAQEVPETREVITVQEPSLAASQSLAVNPAATVPARPAASAVVTAANAPLIRVRADILDRLVNQAGEVSISRSRLETDVGSLRQSLLELTENVNRLRGQLREIEMQAETQITSRMTQTSDREFDPLEFDRFTRLQELTRMMAESVNDVNSVQQNLSRTLDGAAGGLSSQARLTRELQQDLMRVRMVQFASVSERLFRVARQAAKEVDKRVNLDIRGNSVEIDRGVLEKMTGPFEHLLRNAIVHGIESREARRAAGKSEVGELLVEIRQEGNEVVIQFSDDGQGLNIARIRDKAKRVGLLTNDGDMSDEDVKDLIFHPGFSTAEQVTELAGRGVGMDVVRSEAIALGGRVVARSEPGKGAQFTITLPLTLAVTQVVLLSSGGKTYAVPSVLVEQVQQLKVNALTAAYNDGVVVFQGQRVPMHYLAALLGDTAASPMSQMYSPLMILRSGSERVALHVDEIIGNREVVVKNIGPQLARMIGIAGATVLGSGDIVLILNPVPLAQRAAQDNVRAPRLIPSDAPANMGAVAQMSVSSPSTPVSEPVQGLRTQNIVMVVDDSLTVRRVTQRLLSREGYQVVLAKDGVDALEQLQSVTPGVMLVDIEMPRMDGFDLTRNVRSDERTRHIPIIMITSRTAEKHRNYAMELGVNEYLGKPYREDELLKFISEFVNREAQAI
ncbi:Hpt domain-containing protein [Noviherbaspirillum massiliense]|uniref:Hpt domain-containing protein n=1 Tax=Noviherbaspirillum massiliense TaxID=1465823 RepID=UPI00030F058F|nr:Hpt domain-containing protein [Noviherbaspirillum massiliense]